MTTLQQNVFNHEVNHNNVFHCFCVFKDFVFRDLFFRDFSFLCYLCFFVIFCSGFVFSVFFLCFVFFHQCFGPQRGGPTHFEHFEYLNI